VWLGLVVPLALSAVLVGISRKDRQNLLMQEAASVSEGIVQDLAERMAYYRSFASALATDHEVHKLLAMDSPSQIRDSSEDFLLIARATRSSIDQLRVVDMSGKEKVWVGFDEFTGGYILRNSDPSTFVRNRDWFLQGSALASGESWIGPTELYRRFGKWTYTPGQPIEPYFRIVAPVFDSRQTRLGIVIVNLKIDGRAFGGPGDERPWMAVGEDGHFIYSRTAFRSVLKSPDGNFRVPTLTEEFGLEPSALPSERGQLQVGDGLLFYRRLWLSNGASWILLRFTPGSALRQLTQAHVIALVAVWSLSLGLILLASNGLKRRRSQREREQLARLLDSILRAPTGLGLLVTEPGGIVMRINAGAQAIFGITPEVEGKASIQELLGTPLPDVPDLPTPSALDSKTMGANPDLGRGDYRVVNTADGRRVLLAHASTPLKDRNGETFGTLVQVQDVGRIQAREELLRNAAQDAQAASRMKSAFLATMSHEVRTPMNGILGMVRVLKSTPLAPDQAEIVEVGERAAGELLQLLDRVLDLSKLESGRASFEKLPFSPAQVTRECGAMWKIQAEGKGLAFVEEIPAEGALALGDGIRLRQVLNNLLGNACKFTERGRIALRLKATALGGTLVLVWEVADTGIGISVQDQAKVFDPFTQADEESTRAHGGTGLGLAICREIAVRMGGSIEVESQPGKGSVFRLRLSLPLVETD
jgi:signal transduction histidine kinase